MRVYKQIKEINCVGSINEILNYIEKHNKYIDNIIIRKKEYTTIYDKQKPIQFIAKIIFTKGDYDETEI